MSWHTLCHLLRDRAHVTGDRACLRFGEQRLTVAELDRWSDAIALVLRGRGVSAGDRVALMMPNGVEFPATWFGVAKLGAVVVPINARAGESDLGYLLDHSEARLAVAGAEQAAALRAAQPRSATLEQVVVAGAEAEDDNFAFDRRHRATADMAPPIDHLRSSDLVCVQYTSGTTGFPKGCLTTHDYWLNLGRTVYEPAAFREGDVTVTTAPLSYMDPTWILTLCLMRGMELVILPRFSASTFWRDVAQAGVTWFYCLGTMPLLLLKQPPDETMDRGHDVRFVLCSGIDPERHQEIERRWGCPWREIYGSTEIGAGLMVPLDDSASVGSGAMGRPVPGREARIVGADDGPLGDGERGELVFRGADMMRGYHRDPEATARWCRDRWAHTGDLAFRDERGYIHLAGRLKDMIRRGGENISAVEVESVLCQHPRVRAAACIPVPDELRGEEVKAFVQLQPGESPASTPPEILLEFVRRKLAPFKVPRYVEYVDQFPLTPSERIEKARLLASKPNQRAGAYDAVTRSWS